MTKMTAIADPDMIRWSFQCNTCNYRFRAITPQKEYDDYNECWWCGSKDFKKKITKVKSDAEDKD